MEHCRIMSFSFRNRQISDLFDTFATLIHNDIYLINCGENNMVLEGSPGGF